MIERIVLGDLARFLADIEIVLGYFAVRDESASGRLLEIDRELREAQRQASCLAQLWGRPLGEAIIESNQEEDREEIVETGLYDSDTAVIERTFFAVAGSGEAFWQELHQSLLLYLSWLIEKQGAEMRLPLVTRQLEDQKRYLREVEGYAGLA